VTSPKASIKIRRRVEWAETDASGHYHFSSVFRWFEEAEHALWNSLKVNMSIVTAIPRVHVEVDYKERLWFDQEIDLLLKVERMGTASCQFSFTVLTLTGKVAVSGSYTVVYAPDPTSTSQPWPMEILEAVNSGQALLGQPNQP